MTAPSTVFASLPELLRYLAEQIRNPKELLALCLVNTTFNAIFTPFLCRKLTLRVKHGAGGRGKGRGLLSRLQPSFGNDKNYIHVRELVVHTWSNNINFESRSILLQMLPRLPRLESFRQVTIGPIQTLVVTWIKSRTADIGYPRWRGTYPRRLPADILSVLHTSCPAIKAINIHMPELMNEQVGYDLAVFPRLEELTLHELPRELPRWRSHLARVLRHSPRLRELALSLETEAMIDYDEAGEREKFSGFFDRLCDEYGETGAAPLRLRSLLLGAGVYPYKLDALARLTDLRFLEEVHVENTGVRGEWSHSDIVGLYPNGDGHSGLAFDAFGSAHCPNLRRFCIARYEKDVHNFLATHMDPFSARKLAISCRDMGAGYDPAALLRPDPNYPALPLPLRMISINLLPTHDPSKPSAKVTLDGLVSGDDGTLEGLVVHLSENPAAQGGFDDIDLLVRALGKLVNLTQLAVSLHMEPRKELTAPDFRKTMVKAMRKAADVLAAAPPRLRYIKVDGKYWRVCRNRDDTIRLKELDRYGIKEVELFRDLMHKPAGLYG